MFKTQKILTITSIILLLITAVEAGYYIFKTYGQGSNQISSSSSQLTIVPPVTILDDWSHPAQAINKETIEKWYTALRWFYNDILRSSKLSNKFIGVISKINNQGGIFEGGGKGYDGIQYAKMIEIEGEKMNKNRFFYKESELANLKIVKVSSNSGETPISFEDLKIGDHINIILLLDLTKNFDESNIENKIILSD